MPKLRNSSKGNSNPGSFDSQSEAFYRQAAVLQIRMVSCMEDGEHTRNGVVPEYSLVTLAPGATPPSPGATPTPAVAPSLSTTGARVTARADDKQTNIS